jgi:hypothetical protein
MGCGEGVCDLWVYTGGDGSGKRRRAAARVVCVEYYKKNQFSLNFAEVAR